MPAYTFTLPAAVTVTAKDEKSARKILFNGLFWVDDDVAYGKSAKVYVDESGAEGAELVDVY